MSSLLGLVEDQRTVILVVPSLNPVKNNSFLIKSFYFGGIFAFQKSPRPAVAKFELMINSHHSGILDLNIISNDPILQIISLSTTCALPGTSRMSNEAKFFQRVKF